MTISQRVDVHPDYQGWRTWQFSLPDGRSIAATTDPTSPVMEAFYEAYDRSFVIASEKEDMEGFQTCLALNGGSEYERLSERLGPFRELVLTLSDTEEGAVIGGASLAAFSIAGRGASRVTANLSYIFIERAYRRRGEFRRFLLGIQELLPSMFDNDLTVRPERGLIFLEQNDPLEMSAEDYALDSDFTGLDQYDRLRIWQLQGVRLLRLPYAQPALSSDQQPTTGLLYGVICPETAGLDACLLEAHLRSFFTISVLKGRDPMKDPHAGPQLVKLEKLCAQGAQIDLLDPGPVLEAIAMGVEMPATESFLDLLCRQADDCE